MIARVPGSLGPSLAVRLSPPVWLRAARDTCNATSLHRRPVILCEILPGPSAAAWAGLGKGFLTGHPPSSHFPRGVRPPNQPAKTGGKGIGGLISYKLAN